MMEFFLLGRDVITERVGGNRLRAMGVNEREAFVRLFKILFRLDRITWTLLTSTTRQRDKLRNRGDLIFAIWPNGV